MKNNKITLLIAIAFILAACGQQTTINEPAPVGEATDIGEDMTLTILEVTRPANFILNEPSQPDFEYAIIKLRIQCDKPTDRTCNFAPGDMKFADQNGIIAEGEAVQYSSIDMLDWITEISGGETMEGNVVLLTSKGGKPALLVYQTLYGSPSYFAIP